MGLVVVVLLGALAVGLVRGGRLGALSAVRLHRPVLVVIAAALQVAGALAGGRLHPAALALSAVLVAGFLLANRGRAGLGLVALGLGANALVVAANGAMPVSVAAAARAGVDLQDVAAGLDPRRELAGAGTRLRPLGDVVPLPLPLRPEVASPGDVLVAAGLGRLVAVALAGARPAGPLSRPLPPRPRSARRAAAPRRTGR